MNKKLVWSVACVFVSILAGSGSASARVVDSNKFKGQIAFSVCSQTQEIVCDGGFPGSIQTDIFFSGEEFVARSEVFPEGPQNHAFATVRKFNSCTQEFIAAFGNLENGFNPQGNSLQSAVVQGTFPLRDFDTEAPAGSISLNVNFQGFGAIGKDKSNIRFDFEGPEGNTIVISIHNKGRTRSANVSGAISLNGSPVACTFTDGTLMDTKIGDKTLEHP